MRAGFCVLFSLLYLQSLKEYVGNMQCSINICPKWNKELKYWLACSSMTLRLRSFPYFNSIIFRILSCRMACSTLSISHISERKKMVGQKLHKLFYILLFFSILKNICFPKCFRQTSTYILPIRTLSHDSLHFKRGCQYSLNFLVSKGREEGLEMDFELTNI